MRFSAPGGRRDDPEISLTPLVDVVLQLIIFFVITTTFAVAPGLKVDLPRTVTRDKVVTKNPTVTVTRAGAVFLNDKAVAIDGLTAAIRGLLETGEYPQPVLIVTADEMANHGVVIRVMDRARLAGIDRITIATTPEVK
jgi:biopolymer transport protein ExbD